MTIHTDHIMISRGNTMVTNAGGLVPGCGPGIGRLLYLGLIGWPLLVAAGYQPINDRLLIIAMLWGLLAGYEPILGINPSPGLYQFR